MAINSIVGGGGGSSSGSGVPTSRTVSAGTGLTGGGALSADITLTANLTTSGGNNGTATTIARGDHGHAAVTVTDPGFMSATDKTKLDGLSSIGMVPVAHLNSGNASTTFTDMVAVIKRTPTGTWRSANLEGVDKVWLELTQSANAASTARIALMFALGTGPAYTWYFPDGAHGTDGTEVPGDDAAAPSDVTAAPYQYAVMASSLTTGQVTTTRKQVNVPSDFRVANVNIGYCRWGGDGVADPVFADIRVMIKPSSSAQSVASVFGRTGTVVSAGGDYTADQISDTTTHLMMATDERRLLHFAGRRCLSPFNFIRRVTGLDLTRDFGANNLTANAAPDGSSGTDDRTKLKAIRDSLRSYKEVELILPRSIAISQSINWDLQDTITHIVGRGEYESVIVGTKTTAVGYQNGPFNFGGITNDTLYTQHVWRLAKGRGVGGTPVDNIEAGDDVFVAPVTADYDAVNVGDWLCFIGGWYYNNGGTNYGITRRWTAQVLQKVGSGYIKMDRPFPRTFEASVDSSYNSGTRIFKDSSGVGIVGNAFARFNDMAADNDIVTADGSYAGKMFHSRVNLYGIGIRANRGYPMQGGLMLDSYWDSVRIESDNYAFYGNAMQGCYLRNISACTRAGFIELGVCSADVLIEDFIWTFRETAINADSGQGWILRSGEDSWNTTYRRGQLLGRNKVTTVDPGTFPAVFQAYVSSGMWIDQIYAEVGFDGTNNWGGFSTGSANDGGTLTGRANKATDIHLVFTNPACTGGGYFQCKGDGGEIRRVKVDGALAGSLSAPSINGGDYCTIEDVWVKGNPAASVQNSNRSTVRRYDGSVTDTGTNTHKENNGVGKAALGKFFM